MSYRIPLPAGGRRSKLDILEPNSTAVQRFIRREGLGAYEPSTAAAVLAVCEQLDPGFVMFDIGANMGLYGSLAAAMFDPCAVHLFEPAPIAADVARRIVAKNSLRGEVFEQAVADTTGFGDLRLSPVSDASNSMVEGFRKATGIVRVPTVRLDDHVERVGMSPDLVKIDVETFEPAVISGARRTIDTSRPIIIIEVLKRRGTDHGVELTELFSGLGYHYHELSARPDWRPRPAIKGSGTVDRDWLLTPEPLAAGFPDRWQVWATRLEACTVERNPRPPLLAAGRAAFDRGGLGEVAAAARRYAAALRRNDP